MRHPVEHRRFDHGVMGHVIKNQDIACSQFAGKRVVACDVTRQTGGATEAVGVWLFSSETGTG